VVGLKASLVGGNATEMLSRHRRRPDQHVVFTGGQAGIDCFQARKCATIW
jgi:hypothetical protein